jgi:hypothetical protein
MSEIEEKPQFKDFTVKEFVHLFETQNWRIRERKDGNAKRKLLTKEEAWRSALGLETEMEMDQLLEFCASNEDAQHHFIKICYLLAKAMQHDGTTFADTIGSFWFLAPAFAPFKRKTEAFHKEFTKAAADLIAAKLIGEHLDCETLTAPSGKLYVGFEIDNPNEETHGQNVLHYKIPIPPRYLKIAELLEKKPFSKDKGDEDYRIAVGYRMRSDCAEIVKLASAACDMSATEYVETLILEASHVFVRGHIGANSAESVDAGEAKARYFFGKGIYSALTERYQNENSNAYFPQKRTHTASSKAKISFLKRWFPQDEEEDAPRFAEDMSKQDAIVFIVARLNTQRRNSERTAARIGELVALLAKINGLPDEPMEGYQTIAEAMNDYYDTANAPSPSFSGKKDSKKPEPRSD